MPSDAEVKAFWAQVDAPDKNGCLVWRGRRDAKGYGLFGQVLAHRYAWMLAYGEYPAKKKDTDHYECSNHPCVNVEHLRVVTRQQNASRQQLRPSNTSGFKGVYWNKKRQKWQAQITVNTKARNLGRFTSKEEAARVYDKAALEAYGEHALTNEMLGLYKEDNHDEF